MIELRGSTWDHVRGFDPMQATARQYMLEHPDVRITWDRRTLQEFAELSVLDLAERYDFIVLDHPWTGAAVKRKSLLPLDEYLDAAFLADQAANTVGPSHVSYQKDDHQWGLAIDTASHVSAYRPDLLAARQLAVPRTWDEVLALARQLHGGPTQMAMPYMVVDCSCTFLSLCANMGEPAMRTQGYVVSRTMGRRVLQMMQDLRDMSHPESLNWNPPQLLDRMAQTDQIAYCPLLFGYSNYARPGFRRHLVRFNNIPLGADGKPSGALLGGAGLAVSRHTRWPKEACAYAAYVASPAIQHDLYFRSGGQPGHRSAWLAAPVNEACNNFFRDTLATLDSTYLRPTCKGYIDVQDTIARLLHQFLSNDRGPDQTLDQVDMVYRNSLAE
jgi:multiple sugar transport system substrate-binding protein